MSAIEAEFSEQEIDDKVNELGLRGRALVRPDEVCRALGCSRAFYYRSLADPLGHFAISEKLVGCPPRRFALLLLQRERDPLPIRRRGRKKASA